MTGGATDPYRILGVSPGASDGEVRVAYRRLVQLHHPDHNGGSPESARRFEAIQAAYAQILELRRADPGVAPGHQSGARHDPDVEVRIAALERELAAQRQVRAREQADARAAEERRASRNAQPRRPTPEELGHYETDDSLTDILADAETELARRLGEARRHPLAQRLTDLFRR